jgi:hypothetical protein
MIKHILKVLGGHQQRPEVDDFQVMHVIYRLDTISYDEESNNVIGYSTTGYKLQNLDNWNIENRIPGAEVSDEILENWLLEKINLEELKTVNIANLKPLPK